MLVSHQRRLNFAMHDNINSRAIFTASITSAHHQEVLVAKSTASNSSFVYLTTVLYSGNLLDLMTDRQHQISSYLSDY